MKKGSSRSFFVLSGLVFCLAALLIGIFGPNLVSAQQKITDNLIDKAQKAKQSGDAKLFELYLYEAETANPFDTKARTLHAQYYVDGGDFGHAIAIYQSGGVSPNYAFLGNLALKAQDYNLATRFFDNASREGLVAEGLAGKAISYFNLRNVEQGCNLADDAFKLDVNNKRANSAKSVCTVMANGGVGESTLPPGLTDPKLSSKRERAYFLAESGVPVVAESELESSLENTPGDWLFLANFAASRKEYDKALRRIEQGLKKDPTNWEILQAAVIFNENLASKSTGKQRQNYIDSSIHYKTILEQIPRYRARGNSLKIGP